MREMSAQYAAILVFLLVAIAFVAGNLILNRLFRPQHPYPQKLNTYECGEQPVGGPWVRFNIRFYIVAIIFIIFDVEVLFLFPWAVVYKDLGLFAFVEMFIFLLILTVGLAYVWKKGHLEWVLARRTPRA
ncbi:MAG TPA: NADH-quinone oxidoreductase subunit A [bacterium]|nr:NADH-quinone oxidoreductase subunit A [bacterium]HQP97105.1 NADH-quinone oxidoreductase subunit A [bacterium]